MKKLVTAVMAMLLAASVSFAQESTTKSPTTSTKTKSHKTHKKHSSSHKSTQTQKPSEGATMNPTSGSTSNGAGKSAKVQTTTKEKEDNLNDMDKSRN